MIDRFDDWFCPRPWRAATREVEWRPGGRSLVVMHGPNGEEMPNEGIILDFQPERRSSLRTRSRATGSRAARSCRAVRDRGGRRGHPLHGDRRHWTDEALEQHRAMGFEGGWGAMADQLKTLAEGGTL